MESYRGTENRVSAHHVAVTVVIPTRNRIAFLAEAVESVRRQTLEHWELVVVDDASDDGVATEAGRLLGDDPRMQLVALEEHVERGQARNIGLARASGRYVLFLDDDDRLLPRALERLTGILDSDSEASVIIGARHAFDGRGHARREPHPRFRVRRPLAFELLLGWLSVWVAVPGQCLMRADALRALGGWNEGLVVGEDQELLLRLASGRPAVLVPQTVLEYRLHSSQWRPKDVRAQEDAFRREIGMRLASTQLDLAATSRAGELLREADADYDSWKYASAIRLLLAAARVSPGVVSSPLTGPPYIHLCAKAIVGSLLGSTGARYLRDARGRCRRVLHRDPEAHVRTLCEALPPRSRDGDPAVERPQR